MRTTKQKVISYIIIILSVLIVAGLGSLFVNLGSEWYGTLTRPSQFVPDFLIPVVWTVIYSIFIVVLCIWTSKQAINKKTTVLLIINAILNILWCLVFFTLNQTFLGLVFIILLLISAYFLVFEIKKYSNLYFYLTLIYPVWASIATCLNLSLWILN